MTFVDIVDSTTYAAEVGDRRWSDLLGTFHQRGAAGDRPPSRPYSDWLLVGTIKNGRREPASSATNRRRLRRDADGGLLWHEQVELIVAWRFRRRKPTCGSADQRPAICRRRVGARGRKQYRYHPQWREVRDETKYGHTLRFAKALPRIRRRVEKDMWRKA